MIRTVAAALLLTASALPAAAQRWTADLYGGGTQYRAIAGQSAADAASLVAGLRFATTRWSAFASAAAPLTRESPAWGALGAAADLLLGRGKLRFGVDASADGFAYSLSDAPDGAGFTLGVLPQVALTHGAASVRLRAGRRDYLHHQSASSEQRHVNEAAATATLRLGPGAVAADTRVLFRDGSTWPFAGLSVSLPLPAVRLWASAGQWFADDIDDIAWSVTAAMTAGRGEVWASARHDALDPLYLSPARSTWNIGYSLPLGARPTRAAPAVAPVVEAGRVTIRLARSGRAARGPVSVAGDFNDWTPVPMALSGDVWELSVSAASGVLRFAFVDADGEWFVPEGYPGRLDDGMGGHVVVVVIP